MTIFSSNAGRYTLILDVYENSNSINIANNTSSVHWTLKLRSDSGYCQWNPGPGDFHVKLNGSVVWSAENPSLWYSSIGATITLASGNTTIGHNSDGSKTIYCEGKYAANSNADYLPKSSTCGGNLTLSTIPRASSIKSISGNTIGGSQTITIDRKSSSFTHSLWYKIGNGGWFDIDSGIGTSKTWTLPTSLNNQILNGTSLTLTYILRTYNGTTQIGSDVYYDYTVYYSGNNPNAGSVAITYANLFNGKFIANHSTATIKHTGYGGVYGSSIKSAQVIFNGGWKGTTNYDTGKLTAGTYTFQGVVTDSRNKTVYTGQQSFTCHQINNPSISINAYRSDAGGNADPGGTYITIIPTYSAHDPVGGNSIKTNSFTCTSLMTDGTSIISGAKKILSGAAVDSEYVISGTVTDQLGRSSATSIKVGTAFAILDVRPDEKGMAFGKYSTGPDKFEVAWSAYFDKDVKFNNSIIANKVVSDSIHLNDNIETRYISPIQSFEGNGNSAAYLKMWTIKVISAYANTPLEFYFVQRGAITPTRLNVKFYSSPNTDTNVDTFTYIGDTRGLYIVKEAASTWGIYIKKSEAWDAIHSYYITKLGNFFDIEFVGSNSTSLPSGYITAIDFYANKMYPVGTIYTSTSSTNPGIFFGGTWVQFGQGKTLVGVNTAESEFNTVEKTGGEKTHKLTISEMPSHDHYINTWAASTSGSQALYFYGQKGTPGNRYTGSTGGGDAHNNLQPYITVYFWKRTA